MDFEWLIRAEVVRECIKELFSLKIHNSFPAYLCLKRVSVRHGRTSALRPNFKEFFDTFLAVPGGPDEQPYLRPFSSRQQTPETMWLNRNVAGSFAVSSLRAGKAFLKVALITGQRARAQYSLKERHWELARRHLMGGKQVPILSLASFMYRDFAFRDPDPKTVVGVFREELGYLGSDGEAEFEHLYRDDVQTRDTTAWFEKSP